ASTAGVLRVPGYVFFRSSTTRTEGIARRILSRRERAVAYDHAAVLHDRAYGGNAHAHEVEEAGRAQDHEIRAFPRFQAPPLRLQPEGIRGVERGRGERLLQREAHREAGHRHGERHRRGEAAARIAVGGESD